MRIMTKYAIRNLLRRKWRTLMTIGGLFLSIFAIILMFSLSRGLAIRTTATGDDKNILLISRKGKSVMFGSIKGDELVHLMQLKDIAEDANGDQLISPEVMHVSIAESDDKKGKAPLSIRGVSNIAYEVHRKVKLIEGNFPENANEIMVGKTVYIKLGLTEDTLKIGSYIKFENVEWLICGKFEANNSLFESELWCVDEDLMTILKRRTHTFAVIAFTDKQAAEKGLTSFSKTGAISRYFKGWIENTYYRDFSKNLQWIVWISFITSIAVLVAAILIGINTMYTAIVNRMREFGTLRVLGFSRIDIIATLIFESIFLALLGGILGIIPGLFLNGVPVKIANSAFSLIVDSSVIIAGLSVTLLIGLLGAILPSMHIIKNTIIASLNTRR